jgi:hypothetical protein
VKDLAFWRGAIHNAKSVLILKSVGEELANFKNQSNLLGDEVKLTEAQLETLRLEYSLKMKKLNSETFPIKQPGKPKFKK